VLLPARLRDSWKLSAVRHLSQRNTRKTELTDESARSSCHAASVADTCRTCVFRKLLQLDLCQFPLSIICFRVSDQLFEFSALRSIFRNSCLASLVLVDHCFLRHLCSPEPGLHRLLFLRAICRNHCSTGFCPTGGGTIVEVGLKRNSFLSLPAETILKDRGSDQILLSNGGNVMPLL